MGISIFDAAKYFVSRDDNMTHLKLQKLAYYSQCYCLAGYGETMFSEKFEAWAHGPVCPSLYNVYKSYGYKPIPNMGSIDISRIPSYIIEVLEYVWNKLGHMDAKNLEEMTHQELPWIEARGDVPYGGICNETINETLMKDYYKGLMNMDNQRKPLKPLFTLDEIKRVAPNIDRSSRGSDEQYFEAINEEMDEFKLLRERVAGGWRVEK